MAKKSDVVFPYSKIKLSIANLLKENKYLGDVAAEGDIKKEIRVKLSYNNKEPAMQEVKRVSKPGRRVYASAEELHNVRNGFGIAIVSTSKGIMTNKEARKKNMGGEVICEVY